jgi:peptide/nickel transport system ATP-binding protein
MSLLEVRGLNVTIPLGKNELHPVRDVSLSVSRGETVCIVGESGSGKSLTAFAIAGLLPLAAQRSADKIMVCGESLADAEPARMRAVRGSRLGFIFQDPMTSLNPVMTIGRQLVEVFVEHRRGDRGAARRRALELLDRVGIPFPQMRYKQYPHELSGGLRQRCMIAMALMCSPELLIADEPTTALDVTTQAQILLLLAELQREMGMGIVLITHDLGVVSAIADRVYVMYAGQVVESGTATALFENPRHPYLLGLLSCVPVPGVHPRGAALSTIPGTVPIVTTSIKGCAFRERCARPAAVCANVDPELAGTEEGRSYRCHFPAASAGRAKALHGAVAEGRSK